VPTAEVVHHEQLSTAAVPGPDGWPEVET